jgi:hypothetical protein
MRPLFAAAGHTMPIDDVAAMLDCEGLKDVTLLGRSNGGMAATGVADEARRRSQPIKSFERKLRIASHEPPLPRACIRARRSGDTFRQSAERAKSDSTWKHYEMDASHNPHITCPQELIATLTRIMAET